MLPSEQRRFVKEGLKRLNMHSLQEYYSSEHWGIVKSAKDERCKRCNVCNVSSLDVFKEKATTFHLHHLTYENLGREKGFELVWLCESCHEEVHMMIDALLEGEDSLIDIVTTYCRLSKTEPELTYKIRVLEAKHLAMEQSNAVRHKLNG